jgi:hypothetical protein
LWLIKHWFSASTFVGKIATFSKPETVKCTFYGDIRQEITLNGFTDTS